MLTLALVRSLAEQRLGECRRGLPIKAAYSDALEPDWIRETIQLLLTKSAKANQPEDAAIGRPAKDGAPEGPDRLVQPLRVVNHDDERRFIGERGDELDERVEEHRGMMNSVWRGFTICELAQCRVGPRLASNGPRLADQEGHEIAHERLRTHRVNRMRIGGEHTDGRRRGAALDLPDDARLADAGGTPEQDRHTAARPRRRDRRPDAPHHVDASDEGRVDSARGRERLHSERKNHRSLRLQG